MYKLSQHILFFLLLITIPFIAVAQTNSISGTIKDAETGEPLPGTNIFLDKTTIGAQSDRDGAFTIQEIPDGRYTLVFSFVGYKRNKTEISFPSSSGKKFNISLEPKTTQLAEITVTDSNKEWRKNLKKFKEYFLGYTRNAEKTKILNPEVLNFKNTDDALIATSTEPLEIENNAMGYHITYYMDKIICKNNSFTIIPNGYSEFKSLKTDVPKEKEKWQEERQRAYSGSYRHFISALTTGTLKDQGFKISYSETFQIDVIYRKKSDRRGMKKGYLDIAKDKIINRPERLFDYTGPGQIEFSVPEDYNEHEEYEKIPYLRVDYLKEEPELRIKQVSNLDKVYHQISFIDFPLGKAVVNVQTGREILPYRSHLYGYWGWVNRLPDLLPHNYEPG